MIRTIGVAERSLLDALKGSIKSHCKATGDTRGDLAAECGISEEYLGNMLNGTTNFRLDVLLKVLALTDDDAFGETLARIRRASWVRPTAGQESRSAEADFFREAGELVSAIGTGNAKAIAAECADVTDAVQDIAATAEARAKNAQTGQAEI